MTNIAIFCVNYNSYKELYIYLNTIEKAAAYAKGMAKISVFIADNTENNIEHVVFNTNNYEISLFPFHKNLGYFGAIGKMMKETDMSEYDYVIISNVDLIMNNDTIRNIAEYQCDEHTGWIAPKIFSELEERDRNPKIIKRYSLKKLKMIRLFYRYPILHYLYTKTFYKSKKYVSKVAGNIYAGHGSFIILTKEYIKRCGIINYPVFLFGEEIYLAEMCRENNLTVSYCPDISVSDKEHVSTGKIRSRLYYRYNYEAINYAIKTFYNIS